MNAEYLKGKFKGTCVYRDGCAGKVSDLAILRPFLRFPSIMWAQRNRVEMNELGKFAKI